MQPRVLNPQRNLYVVMHRYSGYTLLGADTDTDVFSVISELTFADTDT